MLAHVTPSYAANGTVVGYHSNRRRPSAGALAQIKPLYQQVLAEERRHPYGRAAVDASSTLLHGLISQRGASYEDFIWAIIGKEEK